MVINPRFYVITSLTIIVVLVFSVIVAGATNLDYSVDSIRFRVFKYTYRVSEEPGANYFIYYGDGFIGYYHISDICNGNCSFIPASHVLSINDYSRILDLEDSVVYVLRSQYGLTIPYRGMIYVVDEGIIVLLPVFITNKSVNLEDVLHSLKSIIGDNNVVIVLKILPNDLYSGDPMEVEEAIGKLKPILDIIYKVNDTGVEDVDGKLVSELETALMDLNNGRLPGISFSARYKAFGCLGIVLDGVKEKPSRESIIEFIRVLRSIIGNETPIVIEAGKDSPVPLNQNSEPYIHNDPETNLIVLAPILIVVASILIYKYRVRYRLF